MLNKKRTFFKISLKTSSFAIISAILFFNFMTATSYAQYFPVNTYGGYTYPNNYSQLNVATTNAVNITSSSATLNGFINGSSLYNTYNLSTWFQYGTNTNLQYSTSPNPTNSGYAEYSSNLSNLNANTVYYFRAIAQNPYGVVYGNINSFRTNFPNIIYPDNNPDYLTLTALTEPANSVSSDSARLNSLIFNPIDDSSTTWFEWGTNSNLGSTTTPTPTGAFSSVKHVNVMTGLAPATTYYFRAVAENSSLKNNGSVLSFTTGYAVKNTPASKITTTDTITKVNAPSAGGIGSYLGANVFGAGSFLPINILGWLILFILILILILGSKHLYSKFSNKKIEEKHI